MALKPTIYKIRIALSDLNRDYYDSLNLTIARHPSETQERMMVRVIAYCINANTFLSFTKGLSAVEEPDIWGRTLDNQIRLWIDVGEPSFDRIKKATRLASKVRIYCFNLKSEHWWNQEKTKLRTLPVEVFQFSYPSIQHVSKFVQRTMEVSVTITGNSAYIATDLGEHDVSWVELQDLRNA